MKQSKMQNQERVISVLAKLQQRCSEHPIARKVETIALYGGLEPTTKYEQLRLKDLSLQYEQLFEIFNRRTDRVVKYQLRHNISGLVWKNPNRSEPEGLILPVFYPQLQATADDMVLMSKFKAVAIGYAISQATLRSVNFFRINCEGIFVELKDPNEIWNFSAWYDWATVSVDEAPDKSYCEIHLILGKGNRDPSEETLWFCAGVKK